MSKRNLILAGFIVVKFVLQYSLINPEYELHRDEYLHLDQGNNLAFGYLSVPPVTAWISFVIHLFGKSVFWIKFFPALFGALTILVVWKTIEELRGDLFALVLGATCVLFSVLLRLNLLYQPNSLDVLCWTTLYFVVIKYFNTEQHKWLFIGALVFAVGFLNKYNMVFLIIGFLPAILMTEQRRLFMKKQLYVAILLALLIVLPNLVWQYNNQFPVFHHLKQLADTQLVNVDRWGFLRSQMLFFAGALLVIISGIYALMFYQPFKRHRPFFWSIIFTLIVFLYFKAKDYYAIGIYPVYIAFGAVYLSAILNTGWRKYLRPIAIAIPVLLFIPMYNWVFPNKSPEYIIENESAYRDLGLLRWEDGKDHPLPQDFADMLGWRELAYKVDSVYSKIPNPERTLILCDNYGQAGAINYYTTEGIRAVSFNADYINWFDLERKYTNLIRIKSSRERESEWRETGAYFRSSVMADSITNQFAREYGTTVFVFVDAKVNINERVRNEIEEVRDYR